MAEAVSVAIFSGNTLYEWYARNSPPPVEDSNFIRWAGSFNPEWLIAYMKQKHGREGILDEDIRIVLLFTRLIR